MSWRPAIMEEIQAFPDCSTWVLILLGTSLKVTQEPTFTSVHFLGHQTISLFKYPSIWPTLIYSPSVRNQASTAWIHFLREVVDFHCLLGGFLLQRDLSNRLRDGEREGERSRGGRKNWCWYCCHGHLGTGHDQQLGQRWPLQGGNCSKDHEVFRSQRALRCCWGAAQRRVVCSADQFKSRKCCWPWLLQEACWKSVWWTGLYSKPCG